MGRRAFAMFALACLLPAQERWTVRYTTEPFPGDGQDGWLVTRVVDDISGDPVGGAKLYLVPERQTPIAGEFWFTREGTGDEAGFVRIPIDDIQGQWHIQVLRAPGHGVSTTSGAPDAVWRVGRSFDVPVLVRDWTAAPAPGARIGLCGGCGHTPDLVTATAGADGIAVLRGIDPHNHITDVYVQHPGLGLGYEGVHWFPGDPPFAVDCDRSPVMTGKLVDHVGQPVAGAYVGAPDVHRGPWTRTRSDGTFDLYGGKAEIGPSRVVLPGGGDFYFRTPSKYPVTLTLPAPSDDEPDEGTIDVPELGPEDIPSEPPPARVDDDPAIVAARAVDERGEPVSARVRVHPWPSGSGDDPTRFTDGRIELAVDKPGLALLEVDPAIGGLRRRLVWVTVPGRGARADLGTIALSPHPQLQIVADRLAEAYVSFARAGFQEPGSMQAFRLDHDGGWLGPDLRAGDAILVEVPDAVPHRTVLTGDGPWTIRQPAGRLDLTVVDADGRPLGATLLFADHCEEANGSFALRGLPTGSLRLFVSAPGHKTAIVDTVVTEEPGEIRLVLPVR